MMNTKGMFFFLSSVVLLLAACGGADDVVPDTPDSEAFIATSVQQALAGTAVAQTVEAVATAQAPPEPSATATPLPPTGVPTLAAATAPPTQPPTNPPPPTPTPTRIVARGPQIENEPPRGSFPEDGSVQATVVVDPGYLFRLDIRVPAAGNSEGAGIDSVQFSISGDGVDYFHQENAPGFCVFGGGEPHCNPWPRNAAGQYTWGVDGPVVQNGDYFVNMAVTADEQDPDFFGQWNWNFPFRVMLP